MVAKKKADETENKLLQESVHIEKTAQTKEPPARINKTAQAKEAAHMTKTKTKSYQFKEPAPINESTQMKTAQAKEAAHMTKTKSYQFKEPAPIEESTQMKTAQAKEAAHMTKTKTKSYQFKEPTPINESTQMKTAQAKEAAHMTKTKSYQFKEPAPIEESTQMKTAQAKEAAHMTKTKTKSYQFKEPAPINESTQMTPPPKTSKDSPKKQEMFQAQKDQSMFWPPDPELHTQKVKQRQPLSDIVQNDPQISPEELKHRKRQARIVSVIRWIKQSHEAEFIRTNAQNSAMPSNDDDEEGAMNVNDLLPQFNQILRILEDHLPDEGKPWDMMTQLERAVSNTSDFVLIHIDKVLYNMIKLLTKNQAAASNNGKEQRNQGLQFLQEPISDSNDARSNEPSPPTTTTGEEEPCWLFKLTGNRQKIYRLMRYVQNRGIKVEPVFQPNNADSNAHYRQMRRLCDKIEVQPPPSPQ
ncbi:hypothetical protein KR044_013106 [Drosophila immigrans]|nr:hypothetical protein KR044_013106 [Drosophila immigrans]